VDGGRQSNQRKKISGDNQKSPYNPGPREFLDAKELITSRRTKYEECNQVSCPDARFGHNLRSVGCSDASGSGRRPDTYLQSQNRVWAKRQVASVGLRHDEYFRGLADRNASPISCAE